MSQLSVSILRPEIQGASSNGLGVSYLLVVCGVPTVFKMCDIYGADCGSTRTRGYTV